MRTFSELTGREKNIESLRWIAVPLAAVLGVVCLRFLAAAAIRPAVAQVSGTPGISESQMEWFRLFGLLTGVVFVSAGARVAPRFQGTTALVLAGLWSLNALLIHVLVHHSAGTPHYRHFVLDGLPAVGAAVFIFYTERSKANRFAGR